MQQIGAWERGVRGLEACHWKGGVKDESSRTVICFSDQIPELLAFLLKEWPRETKRWIEFQTDKDLFKPQGDTPPVDREFQVPSSDGKTVYTVTYINGVWACDPRCKGFGYRNTCRHVTQCQEAMRKEQEAKDVPSQ
jgi:hypothetical protein